MAAVVRVMVEEGRKRTVASAFDWPGWDRSARVGADMLAVLEAYRARYARVADLAGSGAAFAAAGPLVVSERLAGTGMGDFYGVSGHTAQPERAAMGEAERERKIALLRACWSSFDATAARVTDLRPGPRGGGRDRDRIVRHVIGAEILEHARKVGLTTSPDVIGDAELLRAHRDAFCDAIREHDARGPMARTWTVQFLIRRCAYHWLDHAWEMEDRDLSGAA